MIVGSIIAVTSASVIGLHSCQRAGWERLLLGPFSGLEFTGDVTNKPVSTLSIPSHGRLEVYELASQIGPVLVLRSENGALQWSRLLVPELKMDDGKVKYDAVRELRLHKLERDKNGYEILFVCVWDWGGKEGGLINLNRDGEFNSFRLSW